MTDLHLDSKLRKQLEELAAQRDVDVNEFLADAVRNYLRQIELEFMQTNIKAFITRLPELIQDYRDEYVAFHQGELVDHDLDFLSLHNRIRKLYGRQPVLIRRVENVTERTWTFRNPHILRTTL